MSKAGPTGGALLLLGVLYTFGSGGALAGDRFTSTSGSDASNDCLSSATPCRTLGHALTQAMSGDTIKVAEGTYQEASLTISGSTTLAVSGGWAADFSGQEPPPARSKFDGAYQGPILTVSASSAVVDVTLDRLTISKGGASGIVASSDGTGSLSLTLVDSVLEKNRGGAIAAASGDTSSLAVDLTDCTLRRNQSAGYGGGITLSSGDASSLSLSATGSTISANKAAFGGAGVSTYGGGSLDLSFEGCTFKSNKVAAGGFDGGAIYTYSLGSMTLSVVNSTFTTNKARYGGAIAMVLVGSENTASSIVNSTFRRNRARSVGGAIFAEDLGAGSQTVDLRNAILWGNIAVDGGQDLWAGPVNADHCDIGDAMATINDLGGNIDADPLLKPDSHLRSISPAIDAGTCSGAPATDLDGDPRPTGAGCDIGADEFVP